MKCGLASVLIAREAEMSIPLLSAPIHIRRILNVVSDFQTISDESQDAVELFCVLTDPDATDQDSHRHSPVVVVGDGARRNAEEACHCGLRNRVVVSPIEQLTTRFGQSAARFQAGLAQFDHWSRVLL
jgi:tRNA(Ile2) C34 agmatinyltransferase TiaS